MADRIILLIAFLSLLCFLGFAASSFCLAVVSFCKKDYDNFVLYVAVFVVCATFLPALILSASSLEYNLPYSFLFP